MSKEFISIRRWQINSYVLAIIIAGVGLGGYFDGSKLAVLFPIGIVMGLVVVIKMHRDKELIQKNYGRDISWQF